MLKSDYDVIIIGAGAAGCACARQLKNHGYRALIIEQKKISRYKPCTALISEDGVEYIKEEYGDIPEEIICSPSEVGVRFSRTGRVFAKGVREYLSIDRHQFDQWIFKSADTKVLEETYYKKHTVSNNTINVEVVHNKKKQILNCTYLIGADSGWSRVRKLIDSGFKKSNYSLAKQGQYTGTWNKELQNYHFIVNKKYSKYFAWFIEKNGYLFVGTFLTASEMELYDKTLNRVVDMFDCTNLDEMSMYHTLIDCRLSMNRYFWGKGNVLLAGESNGILFDSGEGIYPSLLAGKYAADSILKSEECSIPVLDIYKEKIHLLFERSVSDLKVN